MHRKAAGWVSCHSPTRISCAHPLDAKAADPANQLTTNLSVTRDRLCPNNFRSLRDPRARSSPAHFERNKLGNKVVKLARQWLPDGRQVSDGQLTTDSGKCVLR